MDRKLVCGKIMRRVSETGSRIYWRLSTVFDARRSSAGIDVQARAIRPGVAAGSSVARFGGNVRSRRRAQNNRQSGNRSVRRTRHASARDMGVSAYRWIKDSMPDASFASSIPISRFRCTTLRIKSAGLPPARWIRKQASVSTGSQVTIGGFAKRTVAPSVN
jgi:hypothetical protein